MSKIDDRLESLLGITKPFFIKCIIAVTFDMRYFLVEVEDNHEEAFDGSDLEDNLTDKKLLPKEPGIYNCLIKYHTFKCNIPIDPEEWDCYITIEKCEKIDLKL
jgi:hypothetical protein